MTCKLGWTAVQFCRAPLALAGGQSPKRLYHVLARDYRTAVPWGSVYVFWGDERYVPLDHADSNYAMSRAALVATAFPPRSTRRQSNVDISAR